MRVHILRVQLAVLLRVLGSRHSLQTKANFCSILYFVRVLLFFFNFLDKKGRFIGDDSVEDLRTTQK